MAIVLEAVPPLGSFDPCERSAPAPITYATIAEASHIAATELSRLVDVVEAALAAVPLDEILDVLDDVCLAIELARGELVERAVR